MINCLQFCFNFACNFNLRRYTKDAAAGTVSAEGYAERKQALEEAAVKIILDIVSGSSQAVVALALLVGLR
jgi:hypothetical protein